MELIRKLGVRKAKFGDSFTSWGLFLCLYCFVEVEKPLNGGYKAKSCGCIINKHGERYTRLYRIWVGIKTRCLNKNDKAYKNYGGRGIIICDEWINDYTKFRDWALNNGYADNLEIDRIDNNKGYDYYNCRWTTKLENNRNQRRNVLNKNLVKEIRKKYEMGNYKQRELAKEYKLNYQVISDVVNNKKWKNI